MESSVVLPDDLSGCLSLRPAPLSSPCPSCQGGLTSASEQGAFFSWTPAQLPHCLPSWPVAQSRPQRPCDGMEGIVMQGAEPLACQTFTQCQFLPLLMGLLAGFLGFPSAFLTFVLLPISSLFPKLHTLLLFLVYTFCLGELRMSQIWL